MEYNINSSFNSHISLIEELKKNSQSFIEESSKLIINTILSKNNIFWCGNGGSASDALHLSAEFNGKFINDRIPLNSTCLNSNISVLTCISNDYDFADVFSRQLEANAQKNDLLISFTTSGNSMNIVKALKCANKKEINSISFLGKDGGLVKGFSTFEYIVKSNITARIQEAHILLGHIICEIVDKKFI